MVDQMNEITLTEAAVNAVKQAFSEDPQIKGMRFSIVPGGCQGLTYSIDYITEIDPADIHITQDGIDIFIEPRAVLFIEGTVVDFHKSPMGASFVFNNPNAVNRCGCGMSFSSANDGGCGSCSGCGHGCEE